MYAKEEQIHGYGKQTCSYHWERGERQYEGESRTGKLLGVR